MNLLRRFLIALSVIAFAATSVGAVPGSAAPRRTSVAPTFASPVNVDTRLGINVDDLALSGSVVFTDAMKQASAWTSDRALSVGDDGNVMLLAPQQVAQTVIYPFAAYPSGDYTLLYEGRGTLEVDPRSGSMTRAANGRAIIHVTARPGFGIHLRLTATDARDYVRNIRLILPGFEGAYQNQPFAPAFLAHVAPFNVLRFARWSHGDTAASSAMWPERPTVAQFTQAGPRGVAWEYQIALANATGANPWFVVPVGATNFYVTQLAALVHARLDPRLHPMFEYADGAWRPGSATNVYATMAGRNFRLATDAQAAALAWYSLRSTQVFALVQAAYGADAGRIVRVLGGAAALARSPADAVDRTILATAGAGQHADAFAVDMSAATPAALAYTRSLAAANKLALAASGGAVSFSGLRDATSSTSSQLEAWRASGGGLYAASSLTGYLAAAGVLTRVAVETQAQLDALRTGALDAYMSVYPTLHVVARPLAAQSVLAPLSSPNTYMPSGGVPQSIAKSLALQPFALTTVVDINAGGPAVQNFAADQDFSGGAVSHGTTTTIDTSKVSSPAPMQVYQSARYGANGVPFSYVIPNLSASVTYTVRLHFAEYAKAATGARVFNVAINGTTVLTNFDIFKAAGGEFIANIQQFNATAPNGAITILFTSNVNDALINGIEILSGGPPPTPTPTPTPTPPSSVDVTTYHNDNAHTGWNASEKILTPANVGSLRKLSQLNVDGLVMAQPLYVSNYSVNGTRHNLLIVATENNTIYAFDADSGAMLWHNTSLGAAQSSGDINCTDIVPTYGINSTPVIDRGSGTIYVVGASEPSSRSYSTKLYALDLGSGNTKNSTEITASHNLSNGGTVSFSAANNMQRASLLLANGSLYLGFGSHCDHAGTTTSGWLMRYDASSLNQLAAFNTVEDTVSGTELAAIWGAGFGPVADSSNNIYATTGNGAVDTSSGGHNFAMSVLKFPSNLSSVQFFTYQPDFTDNTKDRDLGSGGAMLLPTQGKLVAMGKSATIYLLDQANLGELQGLSVAPDGNGVWGGPAYYNGPNGPTVYYQTQSDVMRAYHVNSGGTQLSASAKGTQTSGYGGSIPVVSSNGGGNGIVWTLRRIKTSPNSTTALDAFDASNLTRLFSAPAGTWSQGSDNCFVTPLVANGKVYAGANKTVFVFSL